MFALPNPDEIGRARISPSALIWKVPRPSRPDLARSAIQVENPSQASAFQSSGLLARSARASRVSGVDSTAGKEGTCGLETLDA